METKKTKQNAKRPKKLSALGKWMLAHKGGIAVINDRRAVNK